MELEDEQKQLEQKLRECFSIRGTRQLREIFKTAQHADIAVILSRFSLADISTIVRLIPRKHRAEVFAHLDPAIQSQLLYHLPDLILSQLLNEMEPDDRTRLLEDLPHELRDSLLQKLDPEERQMAWLLLSYPEDSVGRMMNPEFLAFAQTLTVQEALSQIHWNTTLPEEYLHTLFVVDEKNEFLGEVSLASLVMCDPPSSIIGNIMKPGSIVLNPEQESSEAVEIFRLYDQTIIPVVSKEKLLLGIVTADDVFDIAEEEATEDIQQFGGQGALEQSYIQTPVLIMLKKRLGWLAVLFVSGFFSCAALRSFEDELSNWSFLMFFIPIVTSAGGNSGTQAASLIIRGLAINELSMRDVRKVLLKECSVGIFLGIILALLGFVRAITWQMSYVVGAVIGCSVLTVVLLGVIVGSMLPFLFERMKLDPAVVSSPFITTIMDASGILIYINITVFFMSKFA